MSMFGPKMGTYCLHSNSDSRFNYTWREAGLVCMGTPDFVSNWIILKEVELKTTAPSDLRITFMKD